MHLADNVHGDLTSSNMMIKPRNVPVKTLFQQNPPKMSVKEMVQEA